jgi:hypothetical protein
MIRPLALALCLAGCAQYDPGGNVHEYMARVHEPRVISGTCASACTLYLISPNTCYTLDARFIFHGVSIAATGEYSEPASRMFAARFWPAMRAHLIQADALRSPDYYYVMTGAQVAELDTVERICT